MKSLQADAFRGHGFSRFPRSRSVQGLQLMSLRRAAPSLPPQESPPSTLSSVPFKEDRKILEILVLSYLAKNTSVLKDTIKVLLFCGI